MAMRRPRIKAAANILSAKRKPKATAGEAKTSAENGPAPAKPPGSPPTDKEKERVDEKASVGGEVTAVSMTPKSEADATICSSEISPQDKQCNGIEAEEKTKGNSEKAICEEVNASSVEAKDDKSALSSSQQQIESSSERIETPSEQMETPSSSAESQPAKATRRPRIRATANVAALTKKRSQPGLGPSPTDNIKAEKNVPETDAKKSDLPDKPRDSCESDEAQKTVEAPKSEVEMGVKSSEEPNSSSSSKEAAQTKPPTTTRRPRLKAAANVMAAKRRSKPGLSTTAPNDTSAREDERRETEVAPMKEEVKNETTLVSPKKEEHNSSSDEFINYKDEEGDDKQPPGSVLKGVPSAKPLIDDSSSFKCPSSVEYAALHGNQPATGPSNPADEAATTEYEDILQADLQKSLLGPPMSPSSPSKAVSRQRIRVTPIFGQRRNSFVGSSPHNADDGNVSDSHPSSSPYQHHRRERHYSGAHTPFSTMASPALSLGGGSTGHYGSPHKYAPLIPSGRIRTESSCSTFSDFVGGSQKPRKVDDNLARRRDFEARFTNGVPDKASIKMSDLIYYNPVTNPMEAKPRNQIKAESKPAVEEYPKQELKEEAPDYDNAMPVPQLKLNADGELIIDDKSLEIETTAEQEARKILAKASLIYLDENTGMNGFYKRHKRTKDWAPDETIKFYRCLQILGTDFSLMCQLFPNRTRRDLKLKFKKEERCNAALINKALMHPKEFNIDELTKQFEEEDNAREEAEKKWKEIKAANPKCVNKVKQKQAHISAASRILSRGHDIYENENIIKKKLGKRALSAAQKKAKKPLGESEELPELIAETNKRQTRKRRLKDDATPAACNEATPAKQISLDVEIDDDEISRGLNELLETPIIEYSDYHETPRQQLNLETSANKSPHLNAIAEESKQPAAKTISPLVATTTTTSPLPSTRTTTTSDLRPPLDLASVEYPSASTQLNNVSFSVQTSPLSLLYSETPLQPAAGSSVLDNSYSLVCPVIPSTDVRSNQWQPTGPDAAPPKTPADINQHSIAPSNIESPYIPTTVTSSVERPASPMDVEIISSLEPDFGESHADMHSPCSSISPIPMDDDSSQEASLDGTKQPKDAIATIIEEVPATSEEDVPGTEDEEVPGTEDEEIPETEEEEVPGTEDEEVPGTEEEEVPETPEDPPKISEDPFKSMTHPASVSKKDISDFSIPLEKQVTLILSEGKAPTAGSPKTISSVVARSNLTFNTPPVPETTQCQKPLCSSRVSEAIQLGPPETSPSKSPGRYMNTFTEEELMPSTSRSAKMIQQRARQEELRQQEELRYQELRQHELREQDLRHQEGLRRQEELRRQNESRQQEDRRQREIQQQKEIKQEQQQEQSQQLESPTPKDDADIYQILTEIVKGTLVLVSTLKPNSDEMVHEVFVQDLETEELVGEALPLPQHQIDRIVQMMGDDEDEEEGQD